MGKIDTDTKQRNWKIKAELFKPFNRDSSIKMKSKHFRGNFKKLEGVFASTEFQN